jgi:hypothetical protein
MKVYIASFFADKDRVKARFAELKEDGIDCTSRWCYETAPHNCTITDFPDEYLRETAVFDLDDIVAADKLVMLVPTDTQMADQTLRSMSRGGRHFECGFMYALACTDHSKELAIVGKRENVFHFLDGQSVTRKYPTIRQFDTWEECRSYLKASIPVVYTKGAK